MIRKGFFITTVIYLIAVLLFVTTCFVGTVIAGDLPVLFHQTTNGRLAQGLYFNTVDRMRVAIDFSLIRPSDDTKAAVEAVLPDRTVVLIKNRVKTRGVDNYTWLGRVEGYELSSVVLTVVGGVMYGLIDIDGDSYSVEPVDSGYLITRHDITYKLPFDDDVLVPDILDIRKILSSAISAYSHQEDGSQIDVLVLYTQDMLTKYGTGIDALIQYFVDLTNTGYTNSGINTSLRLVRSELYSDSSADEGIAIDSALYYITADSNINTIRDSYYADMVSLLRVYNGASGCGIAWVMQNVSAFFANYAFSVVEVRPASEGNPYCDDRTFAHEIGHNLGCAHDRDNAGVVGAYSYSYGYDVAGVFGTIMSYIGPTITYFSTPLITYSGYPIGIDVGEPDSAYNAMTINNTRVTAANFRVSENQQDIMNLVTKYYNDILDRAPEPDGAEWWTAEIERIVSLGIDVKEGFIAVGKFFFNSEEYLLQTKTDDEYVINLYEAFLDRTPAQWEVDYWVDYLLQGLSRDVVLNYFAYSEEFRLYMEGIFGIGSTRPENNLVNDFYRGFLNRLPDTAGFNGYLDLMRTAQCTGAQEVIDLSDQIALGFIQSAEYALRNRDNQEYVEDLYNGILRRGAESLEFDYWVGFLDDGTYTREEVLEFFTASAEFQIGVQEVIDAGCI